MYDWCACRWDAVHVRRDAHTVRLDPDTGRNDDLDGGLVGENPERRGGAVQLGGTQVEDPGALVDEGGEPRGEAPAAAPAHRVLVGDLETPGDAGRLGARCGP